jgi:hypothetical protein
MEMYTLGMISVLFKVVHLLQSSYWLLIKFILVVMWFLHVTKVQLVNKVKHG